MKQFNHILSSKITYLSIFLAIICINCTNDMVVKPKGQLRLTYPVAQYTIFNNDPIFQFEHNQISKVVADKKERAHWYIITYPTMKAKVYLSYYPIQNNFDKLVNDHYHLIDNHTIKASGFKDAKFENMDKKVYGVTTKISGESACNLSFYLTDSTKNFISGSLYFKSIPKPDSLKPAIEYIEKDMKQVFESFEWKNNK